MAPFSPHLSDPMAVDLVRQAQIAANHYGRRLSIHDRLDVVQGALLALLAIIAQGGCVERPIAWLIGTVRNMCAMQCRLVRRDAQRLIMVSEEASFGAGRSAGAPCRLGGWDAVEQLIDGVPDLSGAEEADIRGVAAGRRRNLMMATKKKIGKAGILTRLEQRL